MEMQPTGKNKNIESNHRMTKKLDLGDKFQAIIFNIFKNSKCFLPSESSEGKYLYPLNIILV